MLLVPQWITTCLIVGVISRFSARHSKFSTLSPRIPQFKALFSKNEFHAFLYLESPLINESTNNIVCMFLFAFNLDICCWCVCMSVCVCVCVCVCCVFIFFHREGFFWVQDVREIFERYGSTILCCEYLSRCFCQVRSSLFLKMSYFTPKAKLEPTHQLERKRYDIFRAHAKRWYMSI